LGKPALHVRIKVWLADEHEQVVLGPGRLRLLEAIHRHGSILSAAKELGMSYRSAWGRLRATEQRLGQPLLDRTHGASRRAGSTLTAAGLELVKKHRRLMTRIERSAQEAFGRLFVVDG
jgi:molybdate transport system regulatory protein